MTTDNLALFRAMGAKMDYLNQRQRVVAQNIANADTPGYKPQDLVDADFGRVVRKIMDTSRMRVDMETTNGRHLPPPNQVPDPREDEQDQTYEVAPAGNAVIMEEQLISSAENVMNYNLMSNLYSKNMNMIRTALGRGQ